MKSSYDESLRRVLQHEGGYTNDPADPGGPTNWGITIYDARKYWKAGATAADVRAMPLVVAKQIYKEKYWDAVRGDDLPAGLDYTIFDYGVNSGISRAAKVLQRHLGVPADGVIGGQTLAAVADHDPRELITYVNAERLSFLRALRTWPVFGRGWNTRVHDVLAYSLKLAQDRRPPIMAGGGKSVDPPAPSPAAKEKPDLQPVTAEPKPTTSLLMMVLDALAGLLRKKS